MGGAAGRVRHCHSGTKAARQGKAAYPTNVVTGKRFREDSLDESGWTATNSRSRLTISRTVKKFRASLSQVKQAPSETSKSGRIWSECKWSSDKRGGNGRRFLEEVSLDSGRGGPCPRRGECVSGVVVGMCTLHAPRASCAAVLIRQAFISPRPAHTSHICASREAQGGGVSTRVSDGRRPRLRSHASLSSFPHPPLPSCDVLCSSCARFPAGSGRPVALCCIVSCVLVE